MKELQDRTPGATGAEGRKAASSEPIPAFAAGDRFDSIDFVGRGSHGEVYRARDRLLGIDVALKRIGDVNAESVVQLKAEFRAVAGLSHPNLVPLHDLFIETGAAYFSMELVEGQDFLSALDFPASVDLRKLSDLACQLCSALAALHDAGLVHRDVKPTNVIVSGEGRLVLLDFGFTTDTRMVRAAPQPEIGLTGTLAYMAPEHFTGDRIGPPSDVYAVGAILHEALTGAPPRPWIGGREVSTASIPRQVPEALRELVGQMLSVKADRRPSIRAVGAALKGRGIAATDPRVEEPPFVGRERDLQRLLERIRSSSRAFMLEVLGASGVGKTELVRRALGELSSDEALVLRSGCRRSESVAYQALDAAVDDLGLEILSGRVGGCDEKIRRDAALASVLFASLARLPDIDPSRDDSPADPIERRREAVTALRRLFDAASATRRLVVWIDDAQWADADSIALMHELVADGDAPSIRWVLTTRTDDAAASVLGTSFAAAAQSGAFGYEKFVVEPLAAEESESLVRLLCTERSLSDVELQRIVEVAAGYPFLLTALAGLETEDAATTLTGGYSFVLSRSTADLRGEERRLLELVALSRQPTDLDLLLEAAGAGGAGVLAIRKLESRRLIRTAPHDVRVFVDSYHDQVPDTLLAGLSSESAKDGHRRLALAHETRSADPAVLSHHFHGAGELVAASSYAERAGQEASRALAFSRAAEFFHSARTWNPDLEAPRLSALLQAEGGALANAGMLAAAGERYLQASGHSDGTAALELKRLGVESLLAGGRIDDALVELRSLLAALDLRYPTAEWSALLRAVASLVGYLVRPRRRRPAGSSPTERLRIETSYSAGRRLADIDPSRGTYFLAASLSLSTRVGDPARLARSLCTAGGALGAVGGAIVHRIGNRMMSDASDLADRLGDEELFGMIDVAYGEIDMLSGRWTEALARSRAGVSRLLQKPGYVFECNVGRGVILRALEELGDVREAYALGKEFLATAQAHHNSYAAIRAAQHLTIACLSIGRSDEARACLRVGFDSWMDGAFQMQHLYSARNEALLDLYDGDPEHGLMLLDAIDADYRRSVLRRIPLIRIDITWLRGQLALAVSRRRGQSGIPDETMNAVKALERERRRDARLKATLLRAGVEAGRDRRTAAHFAGLAATLADDAGMKQARWSARYFASRWSEDGAAEAEAVRRLEELGTGDARRYASMLVVSGADADASRSGADAR